MWRHKIRVALARSPAFAEVTEDGLRGRYLHVAGFSEAPCALGPARFRRGGAHVHDLLALREGENLLMAEICQHPTGSDGYRRWHEDVKQRVGRAAEKNLPVFAQPLRCGTVICVYPYMPPSPETAWESRLPSRNIREKIDAGDLDEAVALCESAIAQHGRKAVLLQCLAEIRHRGGDFESARALFLESIKAHRADGNACLLSAMLGLATTLIDLHGQGLGEVAAPDGPRPWAVLTPVSEETGTVPADLEDEAFEVLIETLFVEPYNPTALFLLSRMIGPWEIESLYRVTNAFLAIDSAHPGVAEVRERHALVAEQGPRVLLRHPPRHALPKDMPEEAAARLLRFEAAYEPPVPDGVVSAQGLTTAAEWRLAQDDTEGAERDARRAISLDAFDGRTHAMLADILCVGGRWEEARSVLTQAAAQGVHDWEIHDGLGRIASELGEQVEACAQFHLALARRPETPSSVKARLGNGYRKIGHINLARTYLDAACAEEPDNFLGGLFKLQLLRQMVAEAAEAQDRDRLTATVEEAEDFLRALKARNALHPDYLFIQSQMMFATGRVDLAEAALRSALELNPALDHVREALSAVVKWQAEKGNSPA